MKILLKRENIKLLLSTVIYFVLGILFCALLGRMVDFAETAICFIFLALGVVLLLVYGLLPADGKIYHILIYGIVLLVIGLLILMVRMFFIIALAIVIAYGGIQSIMSAVKQKKENGKWKGELVVGSVIVALAIAVVILNGTSVARNIIAVFLGVTFLIEACFETLAIIKLVKLAKALPDENKDVEQTEDVGEDIQTAQAVEVQPEENVTK